MKSRTTLILVMVALIFGGLVALDKYKGTSTEQARERSRRLVELETKDVTRIELARTNQPAVIVEKSGDRWTLKQPLSARADASAVSSILDTLQFGERDRTLSGADLAGVNLAEYGLDRPRLALTVQGRKGPVTILLGKNTPTKDTVYLQIKGRPDVVVASRMVAERLDRTVNDLRDRTVLDFIPAVATRIGIRADKREVELARSAAGAGAEPRWALIQPLATRADQLRVNQLLNDLGNLRIADFLSDDPQDLRTYKLDEPVREVSVWQGNAESGKTLLVGGPLTNNANRVAAKLKGSDSIFALSADSVRKLDVPVNQLRDQQVLNFVAADVGGLVVQRGADQIAVRRDRQGWQLTKPFVAPAESERVEDLLERLDNLRIQQFSADVPTDLEKFGLTVPEVIVTLEDTSTNALTQLLVGSLDRSNAVRYVKRANEPFVYGVETNLDAWLPSGALALRTRRLAELKPEQISRVQLLRGAVAAVMERGADGKWRLTSPAQGALNVTGLQDLLGLVAQLRAEEFISPGRGDLAIYGLDQPVLVLTLTAGDKTYTLQVGQATSQPSRYASWSDPSLVFSLPDGAVETLTKPIVSVPNPPASPATNPPPATATEPAQ